MIKKYLVYSEMAQDYEIQELEEVDGKLYPKDGFANGQIPILERGFNRLEIFNASDEEIQQIEETNIYMEISRSQMLKYQVSFDAWKSIRSDRCKKNKI